MYGVWQLLRVLFTPDVFFLFSIFMRAMLNDELTWHHIQKIARNCIWNVRWTLALPTSRLPNHCFAFVMLCECLSVWIRDVSLHSALKANLKAWYSFRRQRVQLSPLLQYFVCKYWSKQREERKWAWQIGSLGRNPNKKKKNFGQKWFSRGTSVRQW